MMNRKSFRYCCTLVSVFLAILPYLSANAEQYDDLFSLKGYRRYNLLLTFARTTNGNADLNSKLSAWVEKNGDETEKAFVPFVLEMAGMEARKEPAEKQLAAAEKYMQPALKSNNHYLLANIYYFKCDRYKSLKLYNKSIENSLYCVDEMKKDAEGEYFGMGWPLYMMGLDFYHYKDYDKALELSRIAFRHDDVNTPNSQWFAKGCSDLVGMVYLKRGNFDSARQWLDTTLHYAEIQKDSAWIGIVTGNMGSIYYLQQQYDKAIPFYEKAIPFCRQYFLWDNVSPFCTNLADCYMKTGKQALVTAVLKEADYANRNNNLPGPPDFAAYFKIASAWYRSQGNMALALQYTDSAVIYQNKLDDEYNIITKMQAEAKLAYRNKESDDIVQKEKEKKQHLVQYGLAGALLLVTLISILLYKRQKLRHQLKKEKLEHEKSIAEEELTLALTEIKDFTYHIVDKNQLIEHYAAEIEKLKMQNASITDAQLTSLEELRNATVLTDDEWTAFKKMFEKVHPGFLQRLSANYTDLTPAETRFLVFLKLELDPKEMASMLGVSAEAIRSIRFRVKKKLMLEDARDISEYVKTI